MKWIRNNIYMVIGLSILLSLLVVSFVHLFLFQNEIPQAEASFQELKRLGPPPYPPSVEHWFGTDQQGNDLFSMMISGAKYTLSIAVGVTIARMVLGYALGYFISNFNKRTKVQIESLTEGFRYIPATLFCFILLYPINISIAFSSKEKMIIQLVLMILISLPTLSLVILEEVNSVKEQEYFLAGRMLGGNKIHMLFHHIVPVLRKRLNIITVQQFVQVLILLAHLGLLQIFVGGTSIQSSISGDSQITLSTTYEWSGLIGTYFYYLPLAPWLLLFPVGFFALSVFAANLILLNMNRCESVEFIQKQNKEEKKVKNTSVYTLSEKQLNQFEMINKGKELKL
ncbi:ABC transporter permease [Bacillus sp. SCS-153A]|uniref:ABC transporter permease n=1 Tax=Rossellomorea sedimentorum TaxID=3115294 RepID=UPI003906BB76